MVAVQSAGCAPIVKAFDEGRRVVEPWGEVTTDIHGVRVPNPLGGALVLDVLYRSGGFASAVDDAAVHRTRARLAAEGGLHLCPEGAATVVALEQARAAGRVKAGERVALFNSASGLKSPMPPMTRRLAPGAAIDYSRL
jgi:threonine synthase